MEGNYPVYFGKQAVGRVTVRKEGLYYRFCCRCSLSGEVVCRLAVICEGEPIHLGILVPMGESFGVDTSLPAKKIGQRQAEFQVLPGRVVTNGRFVPIKPEEPFAYIARLKDAFLAYQNGQPGVMFKHEENKKGTA